LLTVAGSWDELFTDFTRSPLTRLLPSYVRRRRWFGGKARDIVSIQFKDAVPVTTSRGSARLALLQVNYAQGEPEIYLLPLATCRGREAESLLEEQPGAGIARIRVGEGKGATDLLLFDAVSSTSFAQAVLEAIAQQKGFRGVRGELRARSTSAFPSLAEGAGSLEPSPKLAEQSNSAVTYGDRFILKLFRRPDTGINPDIEIGRHLTARGFPNSPALGGSLEYQSEGEVRSVAVLTEFIPNAEDAFQHTLDSLGRYYERVLRFIAAEREEPLPPSHLLHATEDQIPDHAVEAIGTYLESARLLAVRTAELHRTLAASDDADFGPEPFSPHYQRSLYQSMRNQLVENFGLLRQQRSRLSETVRAEAEALLSRQDEILARYRQLYEQPIHAMRIRCHGDYHLGQVLFTGKDFVILDFEGEPARSLGARRLKRSPVSDVAGMLRSFQYAAATAMDDQLQHGLVTPENLSQVSGWGAYWHRWVSVRYLQAYLDAMADSDLLPRSHRELDLLLNTYLLDKAVYEVAYELNNRPERLPIPFAGIRDVLSARLY
jgi:maltose alpha-D-glucosyltransferase / alpha-amylase